MPCLKMVALSLMLSSIELLASDTKPDGAIAHKIYEFSQKISEVRETARPSLLMALVGDFLAAAGQDRSHIATILHDKNFLCIKDKINPQCLAFLHRFSSELLDDSLENIWQYAVKGAKDELLAYAINLANEKKNHDYDYLLLLINNLPHLG